MTRTCLALALLLASCASTPPERAYYLLRADVPELAAADPASLVGIGRVSVAPYLDRAGIMVQVDENRVREARYHLWAEPLDDGIWYYLRDRISSELGRPLNTETDADSWRYRVDVSIEEFHGTLNGEAHLSARWSLRDVDSDEAIATRRFSQTMTQRRDGYPGLVDTQIALLDKLAQAIAQALRAST